MIGLDEGNQRILIRDAIASKNQLVRSQLRPVALRVGIPFIRFVIEDDQGAACLSIIKQLLIDRDQFRL